MASTVSNGNDCSEKWQRLFQMATTVYEREIGFAKMPPRIPRGEELEVKDICLLLRWASNSRPGVKLMHHDLKF